MSTPGATSTYFRFRVHTYGDSRDSRHVSRCITMQTLLQMMSVGLLFSCLISVVVYRVTTTEGKARQGRWVVSRSQTVSLKVFRETVWLRETRRWACSGGAVVLNAFLRYFPTILESFAFRALLAVLLIN